MPATTALNLYRCYSSDTAKAVFILADDDRELFKAASEALKAQSQDIVARYVLTTTGKFEPGLCRFENDKVSQ